MLKKLYKHELYSLFRVLIPMYAALIGFALLSRILYLVKSENTVISVFKGLSFTVYIFSIIAMFIVALVVVVTRFYKNLLSHEGYLTFTLPFTATEHIVCKLLCGMLVILIDLILLVGSLLILGAGTDILSQIFDGIGKAFNMAVDQYSRGAVVGFIIEVAVYIIIASFQGMLMFYAAISIGQQFKNRIGGAVIAYIIMYCIVQVITMIIMLPTAFVNTVKFEDYMNSGIQAVSTFLIFPMILSLVLGVAYFFLTRHFLSKKLNLE